MNAHGQPQDARLETSNAVALLRRMQGPHEVLDLLETMAGGSTTHGARSRRAAFARRWLQRIRNERARAWWINRAGLTGAALRAYDLAPVSFGLQALTAAAPVRVDFSYPDIPQCETHENSGWPPKGDVFDESTPLKRITEDMRRSWQLRWGHRD